MVMATETRETNRNGKGSSPNTNIHHVHNTSNSTKVPPITAEGLTPETSDDDSHSKKNLHSSKHEKNKNGKHEYEEKIRVGKDYQVIPPEYHSTRPDIYPDKALLVWSPVKDIPDSKLEEYISLAKETYGYNAEQALGMLFWHKHDLEKAVQDLANFTPFPDEWTKEDKVLFEQAFQFHGKSFYRIRQMLPDKTIASLVKFYYSWKKTRSRTSVMDRHEKKKAEGGSENGSEHGGSPEDSDIEDKIDSDDETTPKDNGTIENIEEIIGVNPPSSKDFATPTKTSIMTTSTGKTLKRKHPENEMEKIDTEKVLILDDDDDSEPEPKKMSTINVVKEFRSEITLTPIPKMPVIASGEVENKIKAEDSAELTVTTVG